VHRQRQTCMALSCCRDTSTSARVIGADRPSWENWANICGVWVWQTTTAVTSYYV